jgi:uncharacterized protein (TIGR01244 family)
MAPTVNAPPSPLARAFGLLVALLLTAAGACSSSGATDGPLFTDAPRLPVEGFTVLEPGLAGAAQPSRDALADAVGAGYRTVVNLRAASERPDPAAERAFAEDHGLTYFHFPVQGTAVTAAHADQLHDVLSTPGRRPVLLHCSTANRVGGLWALYLVRHRGAAPDEALRRGQQAGMRDDVRAVVEPQLR